MVENIIPGQSFLRPNFGADANNDSWEHNNIIVYAVADVRKPTAFLIDIV